MAGVRAKSYNASGYNHTNAMVCTSKDCKRRDIGACLTDEFGDDELFIESYAKIQCWEDYASYVRHRVEEVFPIHALELACSDPKSRTPTGQFKCLPFSP